MSLSADLEKLQRRKRDEIRTLHQTYLRTKRTLVRNASPARIVRRNMGVTLSVAAFLGMLLAPRPSVVRSVDGQVAEGKGRLWGSLAGFKKLIGRFFPQAAAYIPDAPETSQVKVDDDTPEEAVAPAPIEPPQKQRSAARGIIALIMKELAALALSKIDFHKLMAQAMTQFTHRPADHAEEHHDSPHVAVANAGTVEPDAYNDFT